MAISFQESSKSPSVQGSSRTKSFDFGTLGKLLSFLMLVWISIAVWLILNPFNVLNNLNVVNLINDVTANATQSGNPAPSNEVPTIAQIGDGKYLEDIDTLRKANQINARVYEGAENGDYVLLYTSKMIIYREKSKTIIYNGETPQQLLGRSQKAVVALSVKKAKDSGLIPNENTEEPQVSVVQDPEALKKVNVFYNEVQKDDLIISFTNPSLVIVYRPSNDTIVKSGKYNLNIQ